MKHPNAHYTLQSSNTHPEAQAIGDAYYNTHTRESYIWDGNDWCEMLHTDLDDTANTRHYFEQARTDIFKKHPALERAWKEYKLLEKLTIK